MSEKRFRPCWSRGPDHSRQDAGLHPQGDLETIIRAWISNVGHRNPPRSALKEEVLLHFVLGGGRGKMASYEFWIEEKN